MERTIFTFRELKPGQRLNAGGKGGTLAFLFQKHYPVPQGIIAMPSAFSDDEITAESWSELTPLLATIRKSCSGTSFSVRSSAIAEDSALASFAGEFETVLNVSSDEDIKAAINKVRYSRNSERVKAYSQSQGIDIVHEMAVVVQRMIQPDISGVLFTADPVTGNRNLMVGNYVHGLGDKLVSGETGASEFTIRRHKYSYSGPNELDKYHRKLHKLAKRLEKELGCPQDIEWAIADRKVYILQSRPISTMIGFNPVTGEYNYTLTGDFNWTCVNTGEASPGVLTPFSWSGAPLCFNETNIIPGYELMGNIGGRYYQNSTVMATMLKVLRQDIKSLAQEGGGLRKEYADDKEYADLVERYFVPIEGVSVLSCIPGIIRLLYKFLTALKRTNTFNAGNPDWCHASYRRIQAMQDKEEVYSFWTREHLPRVLDSFWIVYATFLRLSMVMVKLRTELTEMVGDEDADILLSSVSTDDELLSSLGPLLGLNEVIRGEKSREDYLEQWGHRGPYEAEGAAPRPFEDPDWLDKQIETFKKSGVDVRDMLARQRDRYEAALDRLQKHYPSRVKKLKKRLQKAAEACRKREISRSEFTRLIWITRALALRAGEFIGIGEDIFFVNHEELLELLNGIDNVTGYIPARKRTYEKYKSLPPYPLNISGRFDPFQWAADPNRSTFLFDSHEQHPGLVLMHSSEKAILGTAGSAGQAEGLVRRLDSPDDWDRLQQGEILVTSATNIGWTLVFPKAAGIVTDIGAALSHAAIVARELGIPAVVNCGDATMRLKTGDRVRVDGTQGTVEILATVK